MTNRNRSRSRESGENAVVWPDPSPLDDWWEAVMLDTEPVVAGEPVRRVPGAN
ncbi:hypothetical protein ACIP5Y_27995 [Nocardia sp. NPDC088792]|uniref:hypothetical protein n=1 Tax=Nocardia sp. NPDC088792 TaxID=3364332 RepID=UPI0037F482C6